MVNKGIQERVSENHWELILQSPYYLLHNIDLRSGTFGFLQTSRSNISTASFIDGRSALTDGPMFDLPIDDVLRWHQAKAPITEVNRFIFHMAFCGSTLMARALDVQGKTCCYKEPQIFLQLAEIKAKNVSYYRDKQQWRSLLDFVLSQFNLPWSHGERNIVKPSNWVNSILTDLLAGGSGAKVMLMTIDPQAFLVAVFRGGGERVQYVYSVLKNLSSAFPEFHQLVAMVENESLDTVDLFARLTLIVHAIQTKAFAEAAELVPDSQLFYCSYTELVNKPQYCFKAASRALQLNLTDADMVRSMAGNVAKHSKIRGRSYDQSSADQVNQEVSARYRVHFARAIDWGQSHLHANGLA